MSEYVAEMLIRRALFKEALLYQGVRKIVTNVSWRLISDIPLLPDFGYGSNKASQMARNYFNYADIDRCKLLLAKRTKQTFTSVAVSMRNAQKEARSQGWCMNSFVVLKQKNYTIVEVQYRSTELILKFMGDLQWLPRVANALGIKPDEWRFHFASCYLSGVYFPYICTQWEPVDFLKTVYEMDPKLFAQGTRFFLRSAYKEDQVFPYSPENVAHRFAWKHLKPKMRRIRDYLEEMHKQFGKPLPKLHYKEGEYVPRAQRNESCD